MKKNLKLFSVIAMLGAVAGLAACGGDKPVDESKPAQELTRVEKAIADAMTLDQDALFAKAAAELGTTGKLKILATTSRGGKPTVKDLFLSKLQAHNPAITDPLQYDTTVDGAIYTTLKAEVMNEVKDGYSGTITQDGYQLGTTGAKKIGFVNYVPKDWAAGEGVNVERDSNPMTLQFNFKTLMYNAAPMANGTKVVIDNVWDITDSSFKGRIDTMDPNNENVNMDWLIQLTAPEQVAVLKAAWEHSTRQSDVDMSKYAKYGDVGYAYAFIDRFLDNAVFYADDGKAVANLAATPGNVGWIVYSKITNVKESAAISRKNIVVAALGENNTDGSKMGDSCLQGFAGFMYKHYLQVMPNAQYPYATAAFFDLISTNKTAYSVWGGDVGDYPSLPGINGERTQGGKDYALYAEEGATPVKINLSCMNDPSADWWIGKGNAVVETPSFIADAYDTVIDRIDVAIANKR